MSAVFNRVPFLEAPSLPTKRVLTPALLRGSLAIVCAAAMAIAVHLGDPSSVSKADPELARLLRGMAVIKAMMVVAAIGVLLWRFGLPIGPRVATAYLVGIALLAGATVLIWQLSLLLPAAGAFHAGLFLMLIVAWRGDGDLRPSMR